jgi:fucose 4-O-acetylase-like acetyltransferase
MDMPKKMGVSQDLLLWVLIAKGIGIILIVLGHFNPETSPAYWKEIDGIAYSFHIPLFFFLSGYLYIHGKYRYSDLIKNKTKRLLYPFLLMAVVYYIFKYVAGFFVHFDAPATIHNIYKLLVDPVHSYIPPLWFLYSLFLLFAIYPLARKFINNVSIILLLLFINTVFGNDYIILGMALKFMPFFVIGIIARENEKLLNISVRAHCYFALATFVMFFIVYTIQRTINIESAFIYTIKVFLGVVGSLFIVHISHIVTAIFDKKISSMLSQIGYYSMSIYLLHPLFEYPIRIIYLHIVGYINISFALIAFVAITCGVIFPLLLEKEVLRKYWFTKKYMLGLS